MVSSVDDLGTISFIRTRDLAYVLVFARYAATAVVRGYHKVLKRRRPTAGQYGWRSGQEGQGARFCKR